MKSESIRRKKTKINWAEMAIPLCFLLLCITYFVQVLELSFISVAFATFCVVVMVPVLFLIILKFGLRRAEEEEIVEKPEGKWFARFKVVQGLSLITGDSARVKQFRYLVIYMFCLGVICYLFGFTAFTLCFVLLTLVSLGVTKPIQFLSITAGVTLFMYLIFDRLLMFPLPRGIFFY